MIFWYKIVIFHTKYPKNFRVSLRNWKKLEILDPPLDVTIFSPLTQRVIPFFCPDLVPVIVCHIPYNVLISTAKIDKVKFQEMYFMDLLY
jgi:hypothetical protein